MRPVLPAYAAHGRMWRGVVCTVDENAAKVKVATCNLNQWAMETCSAIIQV